MRRLWSLLLRLYPAEYRAVFSQEIEAVLGRRAEDARQRRGAVRLAFGVRETLGLLRGLGAEWMLKFTTAETYMSGAQRATLEPEARLQILCRRIEHAIAHHDFAAARLYAAEEKKEREKPGRL